MREPSERLRKAKNAAGALCVGFSSKSIGLLAALVLIGPSIAATKKPSPEIKPNPPAPELKSAVNVVYEGDLFLKLLDVNTTYVFGQSQYWAESHIQAAGAASILKTFKISAAADGALSANHTIPRQYSSTDGHKQRLVKFSPKDANGPLDPLSQMLRIGLTPTASPCIGGLPFYDGKQRYDLVFSALRVDTVPQDLQRFGVTRSITCTLGFHPISGVGKGNSVAGALHGPTTITFSWSPRAKLWVASDVSIGTIVGTARIKLTGLTVGQTL